MANCIRLNVGKLQITSRHKEHQTKHNRHCFNRIRYHVSNYHSNCEILDPRLHAPKRAAGGYSHSERQALTALSGLHLAIALAIFRNGRAKKSILKSRFEWCFAKNIAQLPTMPACLPAILMFWEVAMRAWGENKAIHVYTLFFNIWTKAECSYFEDFRRKYSFKNVLVGIECTFVIFDSHRTNRKYKYAWLISRYSGRQERNIITNKKELETQLYMHNAIGHCMLHWRTLAEKQTISTILRSI